MTRMTVIETEPTYPTAIREALDVLPRTQRKAVIESLAVMPSHRTTQDDAHIRALGIEAALIVLEADKYRWHAIREECQRLASSGVSPFEADARTRDMQVDVPWMDLFRIERPDMAA